MDYITLDQLLLITKMNTTVKIELDGNLVFAGNAGSAHESIEAHLLQEEVMVIKASKQNELEIKL